MVDTLVLSHQHRPNRHHCHESETQLKHQLWSPSHTTLNHTATTPPLLNPHHFIYGCDYTLVFLHLFVEFPSRLVFLLSQNLFFKIQTLVVLPIFLSTPSHSILASTPVSLPTIAPHASPTLLVSPTPTIIRASSPAKFTILQFQGYLSVFFNHKF